MNDFDPFERRLAVALRSDADLSVARFEPGSIARVAIQIDHTRRGRRSPRRGGYGRTPRRTWLLVAAALLVATGVIGAAIVGGRLIAPKPAPTLFNAVPNPTVAPSPPPEASPTVRPKPTIFVFNKGSGSSAECGNDGRGGCIPRLWVANLDGTGAHELLPDQIGCQRVQAWSPGGTDLLFSRSECRWNFEGMTGAERFYLTNASGSEPQLVDTGCVDPCGSEDDALFSSDGRRILFVRTKSIPAPPSTTDPTTGKPAQATFVRVLVAMDLGTGRVTELGDFDAYGCDNCGEWPRSYPHWSPDRTQIVYTWAPTPVPGPQPPKDPAVVVADADGRNVHSLSPSGQFPAWSPDGSRIVFQRDRYTWTGTWRPGTVIRLFSDIYTIRPDGTDLRRLTTDQVSSNPGWSIDGRIWFTRTQRVDGHVRNDEQLQSWVMDGDGGNAIESSLPPRPQDLADSARQPMP